jgi:hypothetical protein
MKRMAGWPVAMAMLVVSCTHSGTDKDAGAAAAFAPLPSGPIPAEAPRDVFSVALAIDDMAVAVVFRGHPVLVQATATLFDPSATVTLPAAGLALTVRNATGDVQAWPFTLLRAVRSGPTLDAAQGSLRSDWLLDEATTAALTPGAYTLHLDWGGQSTSLAFDVVDDPPTPTAAWRVSRAGTRVVVALGRAQNAQALAFVQQALAEDPTALALLGLEVETLLRLGDLPAASAALAVALAEFDRQLPDATEPPRSLLSLAARLETAQGLP